jgi:hypothetical protein
MIGSPASAATSVEGFGAFGETTGFGVVTLVAAAAGSSATNAAISMASEKSCSGFGAD